MYSVNIGHPTRNNYLPLWPGSHVVEHQFGQNSSETVTMYFRGIIYHVIPSSLFVTVCHNDFHHIYCHINYSLLMNVGSIFMTMNDQHNVSLWNNVSSSLEIDQSGAGKCLIKDKVSVASSWWCRRVYWIRIPQRPNFSGSANRASLFWHDLLIIGNRVGVVGGRGINEWTIHNNGQSTTMDNP